MTRERSSARDSLLPNVTHLIPEYRIVRRRTHNRPPERLLPGATPKRELRTIGLTTPSRSRLHPRASRFIGVCFPTCPSGRPVTLAICEDVQGVYRVSPHRYQLNTRIGKAQELLLMKEESLSMVTVATGFARSEPLHADVQEGHWSYTTRVASEPDSLRRTTDFTTLVRWTWPGLTRPDARTFTDSSCDGVDRERDCADADRLRSLSKNTTAEQGGKKVVRKLQRWIRLSANDRPTPARG